MIIRRTSREVPDTVQGKKGGPMIAAAIRFFTAHIYRVRFSLEPTRCPRIVRFGPFAIILAFYAAALCVPGHAVAQTCGNVTFCTGPVAAPINHYQMCDLGRPESAIKPESSNS